MTVARFNARGKTRLVIIFVFVVSFFLIALVYTNNKQENDELRQLEIRCEQQLGAIQAQKTRVENSLNIEKLNKDQVDKELASMKSKQLEAADRLKSENQRFSSLQQDCKLTQANLEDKEKECNSIKLKQAEEIYSLKNKIQDLEQKLKNAEKEKEQEVKNLKHKLEQLAKEDGDTSVGKLKLQNIKLEQELNRYKEKCEKYGFQYETSSTGNAVKSKPKTSINFSEQISISPNVYRIVSNSTISTSTNNSSSVIGGKHNKKHSTHDTSLDNGIINSVENFQIAQQPILDANKNDESHVLQQPQLRKGSTTTTTESSKSSNKKVDAKLMAPPILQAPTVKENKASTPVKKEKKIPEGVVPVPETALWESNKEDNRYSNIIEENKQEIAAKNTDALNFLNVNEQENLAHEIPDNDFNIDEKKVNQENPGDDKIDNNAEEDTNLYETNKDVFNTNGKENDILHNRRSGNSDTKLRNEVAADHGKEGDHYPDEDLRIEGQNEEEGDIGDYDDPNVMKQGPGPAERNK